MRRPAATSAPSDPEATAFDLRSGAALALSSTATRLRLVHERLRDSHERRPRLRPAAASFVLGATLLAGASQAATVASTALAAESVRPESVLPAPIPPAERPALAREIAAMMMATPPGRTVAVELPSGALLSVVLSPIRTNPATGADCRTIDYRFGTPAGALVATGERCRTRDGAWVASTPDTTRQATGAFAATDGDSAAPAARERRTTETPPDVAEQPQHSARDMLSSPLATATRLSGVANGAKARHVTFLLTEMRYLQGSDAKLPPGALQRAVGEFVNDEGLSFPLSEIVFLDALESAVARQRAVGACDPSVTPALCVRTLGRSGVAPGNSRP